MSLGEKVQTMYESDFALIKKRVKERELGLDNYMVELERISKELAALGGEGLKAEGLFRIVSNMPVIGSYVKRKRTDYQANVLSRKMLACSRINSRLETMIYSKKADNRSLTKKMFELFDRQAELSGEIGNYEQQYETVAGEQQQTELLYEELSGENSAGEYASVQKKLIMLDEQQRETDESLTNCKQELNEIASTLEVMQGYRQSLNSFLKSASQAYNSNKRRITILEVFNPKFSDIKNGFMTLVESIEAGTVVGDVANYQIMRTAEIYKEAVNLAVTNRKLLFSDRTVERLEATAQASLALIEAARNDEDMMLGYKTNMLSHISYHGVQNGEKISS